MHVQAPFSTKQKISTKKKHRNSYICIHNILSKQKKEGLNLTGITKCIGIEREKKCLCKMQWMMLLFAPVAYTFFYVAFV